MLLKYQTYMLLISLQHWTAYGTLVMQTAEVKINVVDFILSERFNFKWSTK